MTDWTNQYTWPVINSQTVWAQSTHRNTLYLNPSGSSSPPSSLEEDDHVWFIIPWNFERSGCDQRSRGGCAIIILWIDCNSPSSFATIGITKGWSSQLPQEGGIELCLARNDYIVLFANWRPSAKPSVRLSWQTPVKKYPTSSAAIPSGATFSVLLLNQYINNISVMCLSTWQVFVAGPI